MLLAVALGVIAVACLGVAVAPFLRDDTETAAGSPQPAATSSAPAAASTPVQTERTPRPQRTRRTDTTPTPIPTAIVTPTSPVVVEPPSVLPPFQAPVTTPYWTVIVSSKTESEGGLRAAEQVAAQLQGGGYDYDIFQSDAYSSLRPGYWVTATGQFASASSAESFQGTVRATTGFDDAYAKCIGTVAQCG